MPEIFLDDVTVSRPRAAGARRDGLYIDDLGSLNGTYVNRRRIESHRLQNGDELQVGKYKLPTWTSDDGPVDAERSRAQGQGAHDRSGLQAARARVPRISISKIRYLEDQATAAPGTPGGFGSARRTWTACADPAPPARRVPPLRVIRQELAAGRAEEEPAAAGSPPLPTSLRRSTSPLAGPARCTGSTTCSRTPGADRALVKRARGLRR